MEKTSSTNYSELRAYLDKVPVIETHEHYTGKTGPVEDALSFLMDNYYYSDLLSAGFGQEEELAAVSDAGSKMQLAERFSLFSQLWEKSSCTAYARGMARGLAECWGRQVPQDLAQLAKLSDLLQERNSSTFTSLMEKYQIKGMVVDIFDLEPYLNGQEKAYSQYCHFAFPLPAYHDIRTKSDIMRLTPYLARPIRTLDDYLAAFSGLWQKALAFGIVAVKDQSAYQRSLAYKNPARADAERVFNQVISQPRQTFATKDLQVLSDYLFHAFLRLAGQARLPVQLHTGHMAGIRNDIAKTNAVHLVPLLELHQDIRFGLFHGNWPYMDEYLFLGKNYPNVWLDLCWVQQIDPLYSIELMQRAVMTVPHKKILAFGGDTSQIEWAIGYLGLARDNVAGALAGLVDRGWLERGEARQIAADWFYNNANEFFKLGLPPFKAS